MTRGQESLMMEVEAPAPAAVAAETARGKLNLVVLQANKAELAQHARLLESIDKASKGQCLWTKLERRDS